MYQKPMPKQDKKNATSCIFEPPQRAENPRETRVWKQKPQKRYGQKFDATHCIRIINML